MADSVPKTVEDRFETSRNFLATDKVPDSLFGYPIVSRHSDYTPEDLEFFERHPEAGGYYDLGERGDGGAKASPRGVDELDGLMEGGDLDPGPDGLDALMGDLEGGDALEEYSLEDDMHAQAAAAMDAYAQRVEAAMADAIPFVKEHESFVPDAYWDDSGGKWTVGYGQTRIKDPSTGKERDVQEGDTVSEPDASEALAARMRSDASALVAQNPWMSDLSQGALSSMFDVAYNLGPAALDAERSPGLNAAMASASTPMEREAAWWRELPTYRKAGGKVLKGLETRRMDARTRWKE